MGNLVLLLLTAIQFLSLSSAAKGDRLPCVKRFFPSGHGDSFVCVCNSTYCDTLDSIDSNDKQRYQEFVTSKGSYRLDRFESDFESSASNESHVSFTINRTKKYQRMFGFGGAVTDSTGFNVYTMSDGSVDNFLQAYFGPDGIEYNVLRVPLAGVDFSIRKYSYDDYANDFNLSKFSLTAEDTKLKIPIIQAALKLNDKGIKLFASAWTAPPWMKTNNAFEGNGTLIGEPGSLYWQIWANYYVKFFQSYAAHNISFWGVTAQNEPTDGNIYKFSFNCMGFTAETQATFVSKNLGPALKSNGFGDVKIIVLDDQRLLLPGWVKRMYNHDAEVVQYIAGIGVHWYLDSFVPAKVLDLTHDLFPDKFIFATEGCIGAGPQQHVILGSFVRAEQYAKYIIQDLNHWVTGWTDWNMALDLNGGPNWAQNNVDSPVLVNTATDEFYKQPIFYIMGHFSKFVPVDSYRIDLQGKPDSFISSVAFYEPNSKQTTVILLNEGEEAVKYSIFDPDLSAYINAELTPHSIKSIVWFHKDN